MDDHLNSVPHQLKALLAAMLARPEYQFPVIAAQQQYRDRYYGLSAAAMLEDLFFDAISNFISTVVPGSTITRPPRGEKGWDYAVNGHKVSHKVSKAGPIVIAALWDATRTDIKNWTFGYPISFSSGGYSPTTLTYSISGNLRRSKLHPIEKTSLLKAGERVVLVRWTETGPAEVIHFWDSPIDGEIGAWLGFRMIWPHVMKLVNAGCPANHIELLRVTNKDLGDLPKIGDVLEIGACHRPGTYIFDSSELINLPVTPNNRALLVEKKIVSELMKNAYQNALFIPMPTWSAIYAASRPPDLYLAQRAEYDALFSRFTETY